MKNISAIKTIEFWNQEIASRIQEALSSPAVAEAVEKYERAVCERGKMAAILQALEMRVGNLESLPKKPGNDPATFLKERRAQILELREAAADLQAFRESSLLQDAVETENAALEAVGREKNEAILPLVGWAKDAFQEVITEADNFCFSWENSKSDLGRSGISVPSLSLRNCSNLLRERCDEADYHCPADAPPPKNIKIMEKEARIAEDKRFKDQQERDRAAYEKVPSSLRGSFENQRSGLGAGPTTVDFSIGANAQTRIG